MASSTQPVFAASGTLIKKKKFSSYKNIQMGSVAKSYMRNGFLMRNEEMRKYLTKYEEALSYICNFATAPF
jgi:hypothetical protein